MLSIGNSVPLYNDFHKQCRILASVFLKLKGKQNGRLTAPNRIYTSWVQFHRNRRNALSIAICRIQTYFFFLLLLTQRPAARSSTTAQAAGRVSPVLADPPLV